MKRKVIAIISAAGIGERLGLVVPKQYLIVNGEPIFITTIKKFLRDDIDNIILLIQPSWRAHVVECLEKWSICSDKITIVNGGESAEETRWNALVYLKNENVKDDDIIIFHDSVRPNVTDKIISDTLYNVINYGTAVPFILSKDCMCVIKDDQLIADSDYKNKIRLQTPQGFIFKNIYDAYQQTKSNWQGSPVLNYLLLNNDVKTFYGNECNFKITTQDDIELQQFLKL